MEERRISKPNPEAGFSALGVVIFILLASGLALKTVGDRAVSEMKSVASQGLLIKKAKVKSYIVNRFLCSSYDFTQPCTLGSPIELKDSSGAVLVALDGSSKVGEWNFKAVCAIPASPEPIISVARLDGAGKFLKDPLTGKVKDWEEYVSLKALCQGESERLVLKSEPCYAIDHGMGAMPPALESACGSPCRYKYCSDDQREFPSCPVGYHSTSSYIDRFGWGGIDFVKYTVCFKDAEAP